MANPESRADTPSGKGALWIAHNYTGDVGYAWANITGLFSSIVKSANEQDRQVVISYAGRSGGGLSAPQGYAGAFLFDPYRLSASDLLALWRNIRRFDIRFAYLTDQPAHGLLYLALRAFGVKRIVSHCRVSVDNPFPATPERGWRRTVKALTNRIRPITPDFMYAVSRFVADRLSLLACFPDERVRVIYNGVDLSRFSPRPAAPESTPVVYVGCRASRLKGVDILIRACAEVARTNPGLQFRLRYAGDGPYLKSLRTLAADLQISHLVDFLGEVADVTAEILGSTIIVVPSNWGDACPSAVLEALAAGKPLIASRAGGIPELIVDGTTGLLVAPGDVTAMSRALGELLQDPERQRRMGSLARQDALNRFTKSRYHEETVAALMQDFGWAR